MTVRRILALVFGTALTVALSAGISGCGSNEEHSAASDPNRAPTSAPTAAPTSDLAADEPDHPAETTLQQPKAGGTIEPNATLTAVPGASELPASSRGPRTIQGFPVPPGSKVKDPGAIEETWQFDIRTNDPDQVIAFYRRVLPQMGFRVRTDVTYTLGDEDVHWDLAFDGKVSGTMARDPENGVVFVVVNPPGQPAIAGE